MHPFWARLGHTEKRPIALLEGRVVTRGNFALQRQESLFTVAGAPQQPYPISKLISLSTGDGKISSEITCEMLGVLLVGARPSPGFPSLFVISDLQTHSKSSGECGPHFQDQFLLAIS